MKKFIFISILSLHSLFLWAQPTRDNTFIISDNGFDKNISIKITTDQSALITVDNEKQTVPIEIRDGKVLLKNKADNQKVLSLMKVPADLIDARYKQYGDIDNLEKLLNHANELPQRTLYIANEQQLQAGGEQETLVRPQDASGTDPNTGSSSWYWFVLLPVAGIAVGFLLAKVGNRPAALPEEIEVEEEGMGGSPLQQEEAITPLPDKPKSRANVNITQLKQKYDKLREDSKILKQSYTDLKRNHKELKQAIDADTAYYKTAFQDIVLPLQSAIDQGDLGSIFRYMTIASLQYTAITREKLAKRQNYDITNINTLLKNKSDHQNYPELTQSTPVDKTPVNLRQTISVLKQLGIKDLDNYIIHGYKLKDL